MKKLATLNKTSGPRRFGSRIGLAATLLLAFAAGDFRAQQPPQQPSQTQQDQPQRKVAPQAQPKIAVEVKTVSVLAAVRDKKGKIISNLTKDDFQLDEDGRPQTINYFAHESDLPLRLGLLVDTSLSQRRLIDQERTASYSFLDHLLRADKDLAFVIHFDREVELLQEFTPSRPKLQAALQSLQTPSFDNSGAGSHGGGGSRGSGNGGGGSGRGSRHGGRGTLLYDAIFLASDELMSKQQGRKAVIILSDGVDHGSKETLAEAIATAQHADTIIYSILFADDEEGSFPADLARVGTVAMAAGAAVGTLSRNVPTERKSSTKSPKKPAAACSKSLKKTPSKISTRRSKKNSATSTASATPRTKQMTPATTKSIS